MVPFCPSDDSVLIAVDLIESFVDRDLQHASSDGKLLGMYCETLL